jgi:hypothetical protein
MAPTDPALQPLPCDRSNPIWATNTVAKIAESEEAVERNPKGPSPQPGSTADDASLGVETP